MGEKCTAVMTNDKECGYAFIQKNKQFYNYTLYMTVRFSINILLIIMRTILQRFLMTNIYVYDYAVFDIRLILSI